MTPRIPRYNIVGQLGRGLGIQEVRTQRRSAQALLALPLLLVACERGEADGGWGVSVDTLPSGAVRVVNTPPAEGIQPRWLIEEELRIGSADAEGPELFGQLKGLAVTRDGRVAVLDAMAREVRIFGPDGGHLATYGGQGGGPGEFEAPWGLMRGADDRLWVPDHRSNRMSVFDPDDGFVTSYPMTVLRYGFVFDGAMLEDGRILVPSITPVPERRPMLRIYGPDMTQVDSVVAPPPPPIDEKDPPGSFYWEAPGGLPRGYVGVPFYPSGQGVFDPAGLVWGSTGGVPAYRINRITLQGDTTLVLETLRPPVPLPDAARDSAIEWVRETLRERGITAEQDWSKVPRVKPAVERLFVAEHGRLWVRTASPDSLVLFDLYEPDGAFAGTAATTLSPYRWIDPVVRGESIWFVATDELGVQYVVRARIREAAVPPVGE